MGVPVVTLTGDRHMSRVGVSLLHAAGHPEWVTTNADDYVRMAVELAGSAERRALLRTELRNDLRRSALLDHAGQAARFGQAILHCWQRWKMPAGVQ
jgi:predicted O-linked N-acetylglucosamine transferase (SPINDLY family)